MSERIREGEEEEVPGGGKIWLVEDCARCDGERRTVVEVA